VSIQEDGCFAVSYSGSVVVHVHLNMNMVLITLWKEIIKSRVELDVLMSASKGLFVVDFLLMFKHYRQIMNRQFMCQWAVMNANFSDNVV
jgi:hypothetical protein